MHFQVVWFYMLGVGSLVKTQVGKRDPKTGFYEAINRFVLFVVRGRASSHHSPPNPPQAKSKMMVTPPRTPRPTFDLASSSYFHLTFKNRDLLSSSHVSCSGTRLVSQRSDKTILP
jgi:hypothetical protein